MKKLIRTGGILMLASAWLLSGCMGGANLPSLPSVETGQYRLDAGDEVRITAYGMDALTNDYLVSDTGYVSLPLIDNVPAKGKTVGELQSEIARILYEKEILRSPSINVQVTKYRPFYILGEVKSPGEYPYRPGMSVLTAISTAGGYTFRADQSNMIVTRQVDGRGITGRATENTPIQPGDTIRVREGWF
ncbi:polysaccharide biosynthesis/export family protein [Rhizorhapis sp. SPR117]|uniref:polysaccharide biosynthesis/export family protein n=1 Tax=Rhizorhapis sp. SPR117 TaxID=2912611 RepID=UPI001F281562|nr:polysaccharide export protein [Rhizorhapis sp. SPR117]